MRTVHTDPSADAPRLRPLEDLRPGPTEVLVRVTAAAVNPVDHMVATAPGRAVFGLPGDVGLGWDLAGIVEAVGDEVQGFRVGDRVAGLDDQLARPTRAQATRALLPAAALAPVPAELGLHEAATVPLNALTADQALDLLDRARQDAETPSLLVTGAAGAVGGYAADLARERGWSVDGLARDTDAAFVASTGARPVTEVAPRAYDAVLDTAGLGDAALEALRDCGTYVGLAGGGWREDWPREVEAHFFHVHADGARLAELLERSLTPGFAPRVAATFPLAEAPAAYAADRAPGRRGRTLLLAD